MTTTSQPATLEEQLIALLNEHYSKDFDGNVLVKLRTAAALGDAAGYARGMEEAASDLTERLTTSRPGAYGDGWNAALHYAADVLRARAAAKAGTR